MSVQEMLERQQALVDGARAAGRDLTGEEQAEFDQLQGQIGTARSNPPASGEDNGNPPPADGGSADAERAAQRAVEQERQRVSDITALCRETGMDEGEFIRSGATMDAVREAAVAHLLKNGAPMVCRAREDGGQDNFRQAATEAVLMRAGVPVERPVDEVEQFRGMSLRDIAIESMSRDGEGSTTALLRMGKEDLFHAACRQFANPTASFPAILDNAIKKTIVHTYQVVPTTFQLWTTKGSVSDFKPTKDHSYLMGGAGDFELVGENGELKSDTPKTELLPLRKIDTYGRQFAMTRQAFINDDIGFITELPAIYTASEKRTINKQVYTILVKNPAIYDGVPLFDAAHGNLIAAGSKPSNEAIQKMMMKMLLQKDPFGQSIMVQPAYIIVPVGYKFLMTTILASPTLNTPDNTQAVNPLYQYQGQLQIVEDGVINALAGEGQNVPWFMMGDRATAKSIRVDYLNGQEMPTFRRSEVAGQLAFVWDIFADWGVAATDHRGAVRNEGVPINFD